MCLTDNVHLGAICRDKEQNATEERTGNIAFRIQSAFVLMPESLEHKFYHIVVPALTTKGIVFCIP